MKKRFYFLLLVLAVILLALLGLGARAARRLADTAALRARRQPRKIGVRVRASDFFCFGR
jgi:hypothetical protein